VRRRAGGTSPGGWGRFSVVLVASGTILLMAQLGGPAATLPGPSPASAQEAAPPGADPEGLFQDGNRLYQQNDFGGALEAYQAVLRSGSESGDLYYNLGNAYFKNGDLGRAILSYERALRLDPGDSDTRANLELARSLTADAIEPMPRFWVLSALDWWVKLLPRMGLAALVALTWLAATGGLCVRILGRRQGARPLGGWLMAGGGVGLLLFGITLLAREGVLGETEWGIILAQEVAVQSAPSSEDDLTLFHVHEGTRVRLDQRTQEWSEVVLEDGRVGWVPSGSLEEI
jgi:hypothetical protein